ncbi:MAG: aspartyl protease family protein [Bacteroidota bacterium]
MSYSFQRKTEDDLIVISAYLLDPVKGLRYPLSLALDTGASHTVVDLNMLLIAGYGNSLQLREDVRVQTANKIIPADKVIVKELKVLEKAIPNFEITTYDFLAQDDLLDYDGVLGLDFFAGSRLLIDFIQSEVHLL